LSGFRLRAFHPLWSDFPFASSNLSTATLGSYNPGGKPSGLDCSAFARHYLRNRIRFLFLVLLRCFTSDGIACPLLCIRSGTIQYDLYQVTPFGNPRVNASLRLSEAYRSLPRPSSPASAKAFTSVFGRLPDPALLLTNGALLAKPWRASLADWSGWLCHPKPGGRRMVGPDGFEPSTPRLSSACSNQLSYEPVIGDGRGQFGT
jgi:hypothetical protein